MDLCKAVLKISRLTDVVFPFLASDETNATLKQLILHLQTRKLYSIKRRTWLKRPGLAHLKVIETEMADWLETISNECHEYLKTSKGTEGVLGMSYSNILFFVCQNAHS